MARGINKVIIVGNLGQDPEVRYTTSGSAVTNISVATSETWKDKTPMKMSPKRNGIEWFSLVVWQK